MFESLTSSLEQVVDKTKEQTAKWEDTIEDIPMPNIEQYKMSLEEAKQAFTDTFEDGISGLGITSQEINDVSNKVFNATQDSINELTTKMGEKVPDFDYTAIGKSAAISATAGASIGATTGAAAGSIAGGIGAVPGAVIGAVEGAVMGGISGATGEILGQVAKYNGASDGVAMTIQIGTELLTAGGLVKLAGKGIANVAVSNTDDLALVAKKISTDSVGSIGNTIDNTKVLIGDKVKAVGFEAKGLINDSKTHIATDAYGKQFFAKTSELIDMDRTIKMPYLGSNVEKTNSAGFLRDSKKFGQEYLEKFPEVMSKNNTNRIQNGLSPITDKVYIKFNPNHKTFLGQTLEHHHINNTSNAGYMPKELHRLGSNMDIMHVDKMKFFPEMVSLVKEKAMKG